MRFVNHHAGCCGHVALRPDGTTWPQVLGLPGGGTVNADTPAEILDELIPSYAVLPDDEARRQAREAHARRVVEDHQELRIAQATAEGRLDPSDPDDAGLIALLREVRGRPVHLASADAQAPTWEAPVALVCLSTAYEPHGEAPRPGGHVDWIDPTDEQAYLVSLRRCGAADYWCEGIADLL